MVKYGRIHGNRFGRLTGILKCQLLFTMADKIRGFVRKLERWRGQVDKGNVDVSKLGCISYE